MAADRIHTTRTCLRCSCPVFLPTYQSECHVPAIYLRFLSYHYCLRPGQLSYIRALPPLHKYGETKLAVFLTPSILLFVKRYGGVSHDGRKPEFVRLFNVKPGACYIFMHNRVHTTVESKGTCLLHAWQLTRHDRRK